MFRSDYDRLKDVSLNPAKHSAANAFEHCEMVRARAAALASLNHCTADEGDLLADLARVHDIGKIAGTANPAKSVELLPKYGTFPEAFINLVKYHDTNLSWYLASQKGQPPSDKAWNRMARCLDIRLLCLFMVADRADCPGGWRVNAPLVWFLEEVRQRNLLGSELVLDDGPTVPFPTFEAREHSAGVVLVCRSDEGAKALLIRTKADVFEVPKGHIEKGESAEEAALRELREETGLASDVRITAELSTLAYSFEREGRVAQKEVTYFLAVSHSSDPPVFGPMPKRTKALQWVANGELDATPLATADLATVVREALARADSHAPTTGPS